LDWNKEISHKVLRCQLGELSVKLYDLDLLNTEFQYQSAFLVRPNEWFWNAVRTEHHIWVRIESEYRRNQAIFPSRANHGMKNLLMSTVQAIKFTYGDGRASIRSDRRIQLLPLR
jgi:hypothetical protein